MGCKHSIFLNNQVHPAPQNAAADENNDLGRSRNVEDDLNLQDFEKDLFANVEGQDSDEKQDQNGEMDDVSSNNLA